jgi:regulator of Ty1 transposition protein 109
LVPSEEIWRCIIVTETRSTKTIDGRLFFLLYFVFAISKYSNIHHSDACYFTGSVTYTLMHVIIMNLRDSLLDALESLPGTRELHIHTLVSAPSRTRELFPYASPRPRVWQQHIIILVSEQPSVAQPRAFVTAVEAYFYVIPSTRSGILYVSKVDSTGQGQKPSPTSTIVKQLIRFYVDPSTRPNLGGTGGLAEHVWIHVFARAQGQYLFPNSADFEGKKPLSDVKLCAWWKSVLANVAEQLSKRAGRKEGERIRLWNVLPGLNELEAFQALGSASSTNPSPSPGLDPSSVIWTYGHPSTQRLDDVDSIPLPCPVDGKGVASEGGFNLGRFIPSFEDDPKARFMDEIAHTTNSDIIKSPARKKAKKAADEDVQDAEKKDSSRMGELGKVTPEEYWERMSFRQECVAGIVTGFFAMGYVGLPARSGTGGSDSSICAPQPGQVSSNITKRVMNSLMTGIEFSTVDRAVRGTETLEGAIKGMCEGISAGVEADRPRLHEEHERGTPEPTERQDHLAVPPSTPPRRTGPVGNSVGTEISPNPFPEPTASLETYSSWIYGSVYANNPLPAKAPRERGGSDKAPERRITVLAARKKRKKE